MKTILVNPPSTTYRKPEEHLGLGYLKSFLLKNGYECDIIDGYLNGFSNEDIVAKIVSDPDCNVVGLSPFIDSLENTKTIIHAIKQARNDIIVLLGGHVASFSVDELLSDGTDIIVKGEGEITLLEIIETLNRTNNGISEIKGIAYRNDLDEIIETPSRNLIENLDFLPFPDRSSSFLASQQGSLTQISGSRGCYGNCSFCSINSLYKLSDGSAWRGRSPDNIVEELSYLHKEFGFKIFKFVDDSFLGQGEKGRKRGEELAKKIISAGLDIRFRISIRADNVDKELFSLLKQAGLYSVSIGIESGHQRALDTFNKGISIDKNKQALKILKDLGIITLMGFIGFDPYTNIQECEENLNFLKEMDFALTDVISKPLFVHARDPITQKLMEEGRLNQRKFPNYTYDIEDYKANILRKYLEKWNLFNKDIYYAVTDLLTAPRITTELQEQNLITLFKKLRKLDIKIYETLLIAIRQGSTETDLDLILSHYMDGTADDLKNIEKEFYTLISS